MNAAQLNIINQAPGPNPSPLAPLPRSGSEGERRGRPTRGKGGVTRREEKAADSSTDAVVGALRVYPQAKRGKGKAKSVAEDAAETVLFTAPEEGARRAPQQELTVADAVKDDQKGARSTPQQPAKPALQKAAPMKVAHKKAARKAGKL